MARVLVVDDEPNVRRSFMMFLRHGGHEVFSAADAAGAIKQLEEQPFDVVLSDIVLRRDDGMSLLRQISDRWPDTQVVLVTGQPSIDTAADAVRDGAFAYLRKPVSGPALLEVVNGAAQVKLLQEENRRLASEGRMVREELERLQARMQAHSAGEAEKFLLSETRLLRVADNVPGVMYQLRRESKGRLSFTFLGRRCEELLRLDPEEVTFDSNLLFDCIDSDDRATFERSLGQSAEHATIWRWEGRLHPPGGEEIWLQVHSHPERGDDDAVTWNGVMIDVTDKKQLQDELLLADRLASVGSLVQGVVHELSNPLTVVFANLELVASRLSAHESTEELSELTADTLREVERIRQVVSSLSKFSPDDVDVALVDVQALIDEVLRLADNEIRHRAQVVREYIDAPRLRANPAHLSQLFLNLVLDAASSIEEGDVAGNEIRVSVSRDANSSLTICVSDTGRGEAQDVNLHAFESIEARSEQPARRLNLFICHSIVAALGGTLTVKNRPGAGRSVEVHFPSTVEDEAPEQIQLDHTPRPTLVRHAKVLVIDDEPGIRRALTRALAEHDVEVASSGREGIEMAKSGEHNIIFCDLMMPDVTGMDVYDRMRTLNPQVLNRFVFITGGAFTRRARAFLEAAPNPRIKKPFDLLEIRAVVSELLDE